jgi:serine/threonine-protein kinase RsbW
MAGIETAGTKEQIPVLLDFLMEGLNDLGICCQNAFDIRLAVDEIITNIVQYAYKERPGKIWLSYDMKDDVFTVTIKDEGMPFDPTKMPQPDFDSPVEDRKIGGLGIYFAKSAMSSMEYEHSGGMNVVRMTKIIK